MKILLHLPHVSLDVPNYFYKGLIIPRSLFRKYNLEMSDLGVDYLLKDLSGTRIKPPYSRLFCDVERFRDEKKGWLNMGRAFYIQRRMTAFSFISTMTTIERKSLLITIRTIKN